LDAPSVNVGHKPSLEREGEEIMTVHIRVATPADAEACGRIIFEAFQSVAEHHGFSPDFPTVETATQLAQSFIAHPSILR
jgi:hypothetical protein